MLKIQIIFLLFVGNVRFFTSEIPQSKLQDNLVPIPNGGAQTIEVEADVNPNQPNEFLTECEYYESGNIRAADETVNQVKGVHQDI